MVNTSFRPLLPPEKRRGTRTESWMGAESLAPTGIRPSNHLALSQSLDYEQKSLYVVTEDQMSLSRVSGKFCKKKKIAPMNFLKI